VGDPAFLDRVFQRDLDGFLTHEFRERLGAVLPGDHLVHGGNSSVANVFFSPAVFALAPEI
jgi:hypothetical protein